MKKLNWGGFTKNMPERNLHIISFDIPFPANYGGVIDVFFKAKALAEEGVKVHLHCFEYNREPSPQLDNMFHKVYYYKRDISKKHLFKSIPYIVSSRISEQLVKNLQKDNYPILMEGLHTSGLLEDERFKGRRMVVRTHNIEHDYYNNLAKVESDIFKKYYYYNEAAKLKRYESTLAKADKLVCISKNDEKYFSSEFEKVEFIPAFHPFKDINVKTGKGEYILYHGNLSVAENTNAVKFLINNVFDSINIPFKIAGLKPTKQLRNLVAGMPNVELIANPSDEILQVLVENAHINIAITAQATGLKLKLLNTLYNGRFCLVNDKMLSGTNLDKLCIIANDYGSMKRKIVSLFKKKFTQEEIEKRKRVLHTLYNNGNNTRKLIEMVC